MAIVPDLRQALEGALESGCTNVVLDLDKVAYADSSALGLLVWLDHHLQPTSGRLILAGAQRDIMRILELSGLVTVAASIAMSPNVTDALGGLDLPPISTHPLWERDIELESDVDRLAGVREEVCVLLEPLGFSEPILFDLKVAVGEALANAIRHGVPDQGEGIVHVHISAYDDRVILEVLDNGSGFDGCHSGSEDVYAPNGRGIMFMRALMDQVEFECSPGGGTLVRLVKHRVNMN